MSSFDMGTEARAERPAEDTPQHAITQPTNEHPGSPQPDSSSSTPGIPDAGLHNPESPANNEQSEHGPTIDDLETLVR